MSGESVQDDDVTRPEVWAEEVLDKGMEGLGLRSAHDGHCGEHPAEHNGSDDGVELAALDRASLMDTLSPGCLRIQRRHRLICAGLIDEDEVFWRDIFDGVEVVLSHCVDAVGALLGGHKRFFFRV